MRFFIYKFVYMNSWSYIRRMKKLFSLVMLLVSLATANAKCDWSTLKLQQWNNRNVVTQSLN